jgi:hypothetical protein
MWKELECNGEISSWGLNRPVDSCLEVYDDDDDDDDDF